MIIVQLKGGLGNQLFQYAMGRRLSFIHKVPLKLDISWYQTSPDRTYDLNHFNIVEEIATKAEIDYLVKKADRFRLMNKFRPYYKRIYIKEQEYFRFDPNLIKIHKDVYLEGYWQNEKYFKDIEDTIRQEFTIKDKLDKENKSIADLICNNEAVSLHIRRGDYVLNPATNQIHGVCLLDYYYNSINQLTKITHNPHFFIFSDDFEWVRTNLELKYPFTIVTNNGPEKSYYDLALMSMCNYHIIANSSFSWWGSWLCNNPRKIVFWPHKWFNTNEYDTSDLIPELWRKNLIRLGMENICVV
jgi:hypothetical protein